MDRKYINDTNKILSEDILPGGRADHKSDTEFDKMELSKGIEHEMEHINPEAIARQDNISIEQANNKAMEMAKEIAKDHLAENPRYYTELAGFEKHD